MKALLLILSLAVAAPAFASQPVPSNDVTAVFKHKKKNKKKKKKHHTAAARSHS